MSEPVDERLAALTPKPPNPLWALIKTVLTAAVASVMALLVVFALILVSVNHQRCHGATQQTAGVLEASCGASKHQIRSELTVRDVPADRPVRLVAVFTDVTTRPSSAVRLQPLPDGSLRVRLWHHSSWGELREIRWE